MMTYSPTVEQSMCYIVNKMLEAIRAKSYGSLPRLCYHLAILGAVSAIQQERQAYIRRPIYKVDDGTIT